MNPYQDRTTAVAALRAAVPYLRLFQGRVFVVKAGGKVLASKQGVRALIEQVGVLHRLGIRVILVHGGGPQVSAIGSQLGLEPRMLHGRRITDEATLDVATMVLNGTVNTRILAAFRELDVPAIGISGVDAGLIEARKRPPRKVGGGQEVDYGEVGDIVSVNGEVLQGLMSEGYVPVVSPLCADSEGRVLNVNADMVAAFIAAEVKALKLLLVTSAPGILEDEADEASLVSYTDVAGLNALEQGGSLAGGMLPKAAATKHALYAGVERVHVISHKLRDSLLMEVFTNEGSGSLIVLDTRDLMPEELKPPLPSQRNFGEEEA